MRRNSDHTHAHTLTLTLTHTQSSREFLFNFFSSTPIQPIAAPHNKLHSGKEKQRVRGIMLPSLHRLSLGARDETPTERLVIWRTARQHGTVTRGNKRQCQEQYLKGMCPVSLEDFRDGEDAWELEMVEGKPFYKPAYLYHALIASWQQTREFRDPKSRQLVPRTEVVKLHTHLVDRNVPNVPAVPPEPGASVVPVVPAVPRRPPEPVPVGPVETARAYERLIAEISALLSDTVRTLSSIQDAETKMLDLIGLIRSDRERLVHTNQGILVQVTQLIVNGLRNPAPMVVAQMARVASWVPLMSGLGHDWNGFPTEAPTHYRPFFEAVVGALVGVCARFQSPENTISGEEITTVLERVYHTMDSILAMLTQGRGVDGSWLPDVLRASEFASIAHTALRMGSLWADGSTTYQEAAADPFVVHVLKMVNTITGLLKGNDNLVEEPDRTVWLNRLAEVFLVAPGPGPERQPTQFFEHLMHMITKAAQVQPPLRMIRLSDAMDGDCVPLRIAGNLARRASLIESAKPFYADLVKGLTRAMDNINRTNSSFRAPASKLLGLFYDAMSAVVTAVSHPRSIRADLFFEFEVHEQLGIVLYEFLSRRSNLLAVERGVSDYRRNEEYRADSIRDLVHGIAVVWDLCRNRTDRLVGPFDLSLEVRDTLRDARNHLRNADQLPQLPDTDKRLLEFVMSNND